MNANLLLSILITLLIIATIITIVLQIYTFNDKKYPAGIEGFTACYSSNGSMSVLGSNCAPYNNMNNNGRLLKGNRGPIRNFHECYTGGNIPELNWRVGIKNGMENLSGVDVLKVDAPLIQGNNDAVYNVYNDVDY